MPQRHCGIKSSASHGHSKCQENLDSAIKVWSSSVLKYKGGWTLHVAVSPSCKKNTLNIYGLREKDAFSFILKSVTTGGIVPCVTFIGEEKLNLTFFNLKILLSLRNVTSSVLEVHSFDSDTTHIFSPVFLCINILMTLSLVSFHTHLYGRGHP